MSSGLYLLADRVLPQGQKASGVLGAGARAMTQFTQRWLRVAAWMIGGAPIRGDRASPLRVATGGNANWSPKSVAAARRPPRIGRRDFAPSSRISRASHVLYTVGVRAARIALLIWLHPVGQEKLNTKFEYGQENDVRLLN